MRPYTTTVLMLLGIAATNTGWSAPPTFTAGDVLKVYETKYQKITTILLQEKITPRAITPEKELLDLHYLPLTSRSRKVVYHRDSRTFSSETDPWYDAYDVLLRKMRREFPELKTNPNALFTLPPYEKIAGPIREVLKQVPADELVYVFDGNHLWKHRPKDRVHSDGAERLTFLVLDPARKGGHLRFQSAVLDHALFAFPIPVPRVREARKKSFLPDLLQGASPEELSKPLPTQDVAGVSCLVLSAKDQRYFLDPRLGLAVRRHEMTSQGHTVRIYTADDFVEVLPAVWLPKRVRVTNCGWPLEVKGRYVGKPLWEDAVEVTRLEVNKPEHLKYLEVDVPAGASVGDMTLPAIDPTGKEVTPKTYEPNQVPAISYIQPANKADLKKAIREAQLEAGKRK